MGSLRTYVLPIFAPIWHHETSGCYRVTISRRLSAWVRSFSHDCMRARSLALSTRWVLTTAMT
jgi:hypothetical protein